MAKKKVLNSETRASRKASLAALVDIEQAAVVDSERATRADLAARRLAEESEAAVKEGVLALASSAQLFQTSNEIGALSATADRLSEGDLAGGLELARVAGDIGAVSLVLSQLEYPTLAAILQACSERLRDLSAEELVRANRVSEMANALVSAGAEIEALGQDEVEAGVARLILAKAMAERSAASAAAGVSLAAKSSDETARAAKLAAKAAAAEAAQAAQTAQLNALQASAPAVEPEPTEGKGGPAQRAQTQGFQNGGRPRELRPAIDLPLAVETHEQRGHRGLAGAVSTRAAQKRDRPASDTPALLALVPDSPLRHPPPVMLSA